MKRTLLFLAILVFCFISCEDLIDDDLWAAKSAKGSEKKTPKKPTPVKPKDIKYTVTSDNNVHTDNIVFSFDGDIKELKAKDIHITNKSGSVKKGKLSGSGASWSLEVTTSVPGKIEVKIVKPGIEGKKKKIDVYRLNINFSEICEECGKENDGCDCEEKCCDDCAGYECHNCKDTVCACIEYNCYYCKDTGCDACRAY